MFLEKVTIRNYGSLKEISFDGAPFLVFIGPNGVGKSLIFEAVDKFFRDFALTGGRSSPNDLLWFRREANVSIEFEVVLRCSDSEIRDLIPLGDRALDVFKVRMRDSSGKLTIKRALSSDGSWTTKEASWGDMQLVESDKIVGTEKMTELLLPQLFPRLYQNYRMFLFEKGPSTERIEGDRVVVNLRTKEAYSPDSVLDEFARRGLIGSSAEASGKNKSDWMKENGYTLSRSPSAELREAVDKTSDLRAKMPSFLGKLNGRFKLLSAARDVRAEPGERQALLDSDTLARITEMSFDEDVRVEARWERYRGQVLQLLGIHLDHVKTQIRVKEMGLGLPPSHIGGGEQAAIGLIWETFDSTAMTAIEEPENHLHPRLQRKLLEYFLMLSERTQVMISSHSPIFASQADMRGVYFVSKDQEGKTNVTRLTEQNVYELIDELGVRCSDVFDFDIVVFVEGPTDACVFSSFMQTLIKNRQKNIGFVDAEGWNNMTYYANAKIVRSMKPPRPVYVVFDGDTEKNERNREIKQRLVKSLNLNEDDIITLRESCIEAYLLVPETIKRALPQIRLSSEDIRKMVDESKGQRNKKEVLNRIMETGNMGPYNIEKAKRIAQAMSEDEIVVEIKSVIERFQGHSGDSDAKRTADKSSGQQEEHALKTAKVRPR